PACSQDLAGPLDPLGGSIPAALPQNAGDVVGGNRGVGAEGRKERQNVVHGTAVELIDCRDPVSGLDVLDEDLLCAHLWPLSPPCAPVARAIVTAARIES